MTRTGQGRWPNGRASTEDRFWAKVDKAGPIPAHVPELGPCWVWTGCPTTSGYGNFWDGTYRDSGGPRMASAHVWAWRHFVGPQNGLDTLHRCDNRLCVRYDTHLFVGTRGENNRDRVAKGRSAIGEKSGRALLTEAQVRDIRSIWATGGISETALGAQFGVSRGAVRSILSGATWKHVD